MHKINFKKPLTNLGIPVVDNFNTQHFVNSELAIHLNAMNNNGNSLKVTSICLRILEKGEIELDKPDFDLLKSIVNACQTAPNYLITAALGCIEEAEEIKE